MSTSAGNILIIIILTTYILVANARNADCEIDPAGILACINVRMDSTDYFQSIEIMIPKFLQEAKENHDSFHFGFAFSDLDDIPEHLLKGYNISSFHFVGNTIHLFPPEFLMSVSSNVEILNLKDNKIGFFMSKKFLNEVPFASTVKVLILQNCDIMVLKPYAFRRFTSLEELNLSNNLLLRVGAREFANHPTLKTINLSNNNLFDLEEEAFINLPNLRRLDLSSNKIHQIDARAFVDLRALRQLNLVHNHIFKIEANTFDENDLPKLYDLQLGDNRLMCDCELQWFKKWLLQRDMLDDSDATCWNFNHMPLSEAEICSHKY